jgi:flagellar L-ring protein FlgH
MQKGIASMTPRAALLRRAALAATVLAAILQGQARGQSSSLFGGSQQRTPLTLTENSWIVQDSESPKMLKLNDLVTVIVNVSSTMTSDGQMDRKKTAYGDLSLPNWIKFYKWNLGADKENNGEPHVRGQVDNKLQSKADLETRDNLKFSIACRIVDIRPNGNVVLEGRRTVNNNEEVWDYALTGEVRPESILPNHTVLSDTVADLRIIKRETGHVRDGYRRGWALEWLDKWQPF